MKRSKIAKIIGCLVVLLLLTVAALQLNGALCCWNLANCKGPTCCLLSGWVNGCTITCISGVVIHCVPRIDGEPAPAPVPNPVNY